MATPVSRPSFHVAMRDPAVVIKIPEIVMLLIAIITFFANNYGSPAYVASVLLPSLLNAIVFFTVYLLGYTQQKHTPVELALYTYSALGLFISSILLMSSWWSSSLIASGVFCLFLTFIYFAEMYFSYIGLVNRPPLPANTGSTPSAPPPQPATISGLGGYPSEPPPTLTTPTDTIDLGAGAAHHTVAGLNHTNPVYPTTMNYPPYPLPETALPHGGPAP